MHEFEQTNDQHDPLRETYKAADLESFGIKKHPEPSPNTLDHTMVETVGGLGRHTPAEKEIEGQIRQVAHKITPPQVIILARQYGADALGLVNAVVMHYQEQIKRNGKLSKHLNMASTLKVLLKVHFGLLVRVIPYGASFKLELIDSSRALRPGGKVLAKAIVLAGQQRGQLLAKTYAGNKHQGNSHKHGSVKEVMKDKGADAFIQKKTPMVDRTNQKALTHEQKYLYVSKALQGYGIYLTGNGDYPVIGGMKGNARGEFDMKEFAKYASVSFNNQRLTVVKFEKIYKAVDRLFKTQKALKNFQAIEGTAKALKHIKSAVGKGEQMGKYGRELVDNLSAGLGQLLQKVINITGDEVANHDNKVDKQDWHKRFNAMLSTHQMPGLGHELYEQRPAGYDDKGQEINRPVFGASKKYPGYFVDLNTSKQYENDSDEGTMFFKVGKNGKMERVGFLNMKK